MQRRNVSTQCSCNGECDKGVFFGVVLAGGKRSGVGAIESRDGKGTGFGGNGLAAVVVEAGGGGDVARDSGDGKGEKQD